MMRGRQKRNMNRNEIRLAQNLFRSHAKSGPEFPFKLFVSLYIIINHFRVKSFHGVIRNSGTDSPQTQNPNGFVRKVRPQKHHRLPALELPGARETDLSYKTV